MPTIWRFEGFRVAIYVDDHRPAHVHVIGASGEAVFVLNCPNGPPALRESYGLNRPVLNRIRSALRDELASLCVAWRSIHGNW